MAIDFASLGAFVLLAIPVGLLAFGLVRARSAARTGGITSGLAKVITDPARGQRFLVYLMIILASYLFSGAAGASEMLFPSLAYALDYLAIGAFVVGAVAIFLMLTSGIGAQELSLSERLALQEAKPEVLAVVERTRPPAPRGGSGSMYVVTDVPVPEPTRPGTESLSH